MWLHIILGSRQHGCMGIPLHLGQIIVLLYSWANGRGRTRWCHLERKHWVQGRLFLNVLVWESVAILQLFAGKNQDAADQGRMPSFSWLLAFTFLIVSQVWTWSQGLHRDLHLCVCWGDCSAASPPREERVGMFVSIECAFFISLLSGLEALPYVTYQMPKFWMEKW